MLTVMLRLYQTAATGNQETSSSEVKQLTRIWTKSASADEAAWEMIKGKLQYLSANCDYLSC